MCDATLVNGPLVCVRTDAHVSGHVYESSDGSWVPDRHDDESRG